MTTRTLLLDAVTTTTTGGAQPGRGNPPSFQATVAGTGSVSATVLVKGRNIAGGAWVLLGTITLSGSSPVTDGFACLVQYMEYAADVTAISGTGAAVTVAMGS